MPPKENLERACEECIHYWACSRQCGEPMAQSSATGCECYETIKSSMAYYVGALDGVKGKIQNRLRELAEADKDGRVVPVRWETDLFRPGGVWRCKSGMKWHIASVSWGKDSLAMLLMLIAKGYPLNEVVFYDTGMEFEAIYHTRDQMLPRLEQLGIKYTRLEPENPFLFDMLERPVCSKQKGTHQGYGWCGGLCRWGTTGKLKAIDRYAEARDAMVYVGIAADETPRLEKERKPYKLHPLAEWGMTKADALAYCYENGFSWLEGTIRLYDVLDRVSCWCCCNKNLRELRNMCIYLPEYWERLKDLQRKIDRPMKGYYKGKPRGVFELEQRFRAELEQEAKA